MRKKIENRRVEYPGGHVSYFMNRQMKDGDFFGYVLHLSPRDMHLGRSHIAARLWEARRHLREGMAALDGSDYYSRRHWARS